MSAAQSHKPENDEERAALEELSVKHIIIDEAVLHYGMGNTNPINEIRFYSKRKPLGMHSPFQANLTEHGPQSVPRLSPVTYRH